MNPKEQSNIVDALLEMRAQASAIRSYNAMLEAPQLAPDDEALDECIAGIDDSTDKIITIVDAVMRSASLADGRPNPEEDPRPRAI